MLAPYQTFSACLVVAVATIAAIPSVRAHPHVLVDAKAEIVFDEQSRISAVRNIWQFDEAFSAFAIQGLDKDGDGDLSDVELAPLAQENVESLAAYDFFTYLLAGGRKHAFTSPTEYRDVMQDGRLTLTFVLPLDEPVAVTSPVDIEIFDPEYFVAITFVNEQPVTLEGAPSSCGTTYRPPGELDAQTIAALAAIPIDQTELPPDLLKAASALSNLIRISCPGLAETPAPTALDQAPARPSPVDLASSSSEATPAGRSTPAAGSKPRLGLLAVVALSAVLIVAVAVSFVLLRRRSRGAQ